MIGIKFYYSKSKDQVIEVTSENEINLNAQDFKELIPNTEDAATEKHVPCIKFYGENVLINVGEVTHPMSDEHLIKAIFVVTSKGTIYRKYLKPTDEPLFEIENIDSKHFDVYSYCNLHGLWKKSI